MKTLLSFTLAAMPIASISFAQSAASTAMDTLNINEVSALILNGGDMHANPFTTTPGYEVPKGSGKHSIFASALWIGGIDAGGQLKLAGQTYRQSDNDFWPGPLDTTNASIDAATSVQYDKIWKINRCKVEEFKFEWMLGNVQTGTYAPDPDILSWPGNGDVTKGQAHYLAPFVDVNGNGIYDPLTGGDYPKIKGDQMLWTVFNDKGNIHTATGGQPLGVEIRTSAYAYSCPQIADSLKVLNYTTLYHYEIFNRSTSQLDSTYLGYWQDGDLGNSSDDYVGCNPQENYGYIYNADNNDNVGANGYGLHPPILSTIILKSPLQNLMAHFRYYNNTNNIPTGNPLIPEHYYNYLSGKWRDSTSLTYGGNGYGGTTPTPNMFPDFPYNSSGWSEVTSGNTPGDRRALMSSGPFTFLPGQKVDFDFAIVWTRDTTLTYGTQAYFDKNLQDNLRVKRWFLQDSFPSCLNAPVVTVSPNTTICSGQSATLNAGGGTIYSWSPGGQSTSSVVMSPTISTTYTVTGRNACSANRSSVTVTVNNVLMTTASSTDVSCGGGSDGTAAVAVAGGSPPYTYLWNPPAAAAAAVTGLSTGVYTVIVADSRGCANTQAVTIDPPANTEELYLPNAFSPNGDGENDEFCLQGESNYCIKDLKIIIYDRWGEKVYGSTEKNFCWDAVPASQPWLAGIYPGNKMNSSVFVYYLTATMMDGKEIVKKGNISLLR